MIVNSLIKKRKEGSYWDFKLKHHDNPASLVHDVICLANVTDKNESRYLIYGIDPDTFEIIGVDKNYAKSQAEIIDVLCNASFADGNIPKVSLTELIINNKPVDVLEIKDSRQKPYYLVKEYKKRMLRLMLAPSTVGLRIEILLKMA